MTPHKEKTKEPIGNIILWPTMHSEWSENSTYQINFTVINLGNALYKQLGVESSIFLGGQEYVIKNCVENFDSETKEVTAWHIYNEINRIYKRSDLNKKQDDNNQEKEYSIEDILKYWLDGNKLGFSYEIHGKFDKQSMQPFDSGSGKDMLSKIVDTWPNAVIFPDNKKIRVYSEDEFFKDRGRMVDFPHDAKSVKITRDSKNIINQIRCIGGKHSIDISTGGGGGGNLDSVEDFCKSPINADFGVNKQQMLSDFAARDSRVRAWGVDVNRLYDTVKNAGVSPEWFFAYDLIEGGSGYGWLNHTYRQGDAYSDAVSVCNWIKQFANSDYLHPAWGAAEGSIGANAGLESKWNQEFGKGTIGRLYLQGTAAAVWELAGSSGNDSMGKPLNFCVQTIKGWGGHTNSGGGWGWPFPSVGEGSFMGGQLFGVQPGGGFRPNGFHDGLDFGSNDHPGPEVHAIHGGTVTTIAYGGSEIKWYIVITDSTGLNVEYQEAFGSRGNITANLNQHVNTGDIIGYRNTDHLHIGITRHNIQEAFSHAFSNDGTWIDPLQTIKSGIAAGGSNGSGETTSEEVYYFEPFILSDQKSIDEWGLHPGPDLVDERFHDAESMKEYGLTKLHPDPDLNIEVSLNGNKFEPIAGEIIKVLARKDYSGSYRTVGFTYYSEDKTQDTLLTLNNSKTTILDYQNQRTKQIKEALDEQQKRVKGLADSLDKQSKALTRIVNDKKETDKGFEAVNQNLYWLQNGQHNLVSDLVGNTESYLGSPAVESSDSWNSNLFNVANSSSVSCHTMIKTNSGVSVGMSIQFLNSSGKSVGNYGPITTSGNGTWKSLGAANINVPTNAAQAKLIITSTSKIVISRPQVNLGYKITPWNSLN